MKSNNMHLFSKKKNKKVLADFKHISPKFPYPKPSSRRMPITTKCLKAGKIVFAGKGKKKKASTKKKKGQQQPKKKKTKPTNKRKTH